MLRMFNDELSLASKHQQILIPCDQQIGFSAVRQMKERLVFGIAAHNRAFSGWNDTFAIRNVERNQFKSIKLLEL